MKFLKAHYMFCMVLFIAIGLVILCISYNVTNNFLKNFLDDIASLFIVSAAVGVITEVFLKERITEFILEKLKIKEETNQAGLISIVENQEFNFGEYFSKSKDEIDIVHVYSKSWTTNNISKIKEKIRNSNCKVRVVLLNPESEFVNGLAKYTYNCSKDDLVRRMMEARKLWEELQQGKGSKSSIKLYYTNCLPMHSLYRFDDYLVHIQSKATAGRTNNLPTIIYKKDSKKNNFYKKHLEEIEELISFADEFTFTEAEILVPVN
ncbi:hypothetical protein MN033_08885 [Bacillus nitratireducens]|uniref:hypothetical protein n=1 Tax=Bacillus nitratireducens TaxID=2026193 RepID=UPI001F5633C6|nr:hypothetical protein [Bacillus nitratireducens]UNP78281.1 hypothetical protein MN033_08885 [Bacillus nitratireducens]